MIGNWRPWPSTSTDDSNAGRRPANFRSIVDHRHPGGVNPAVDDQPGNRPVEPSPIVGGGLESGPADANAAVDPQVSGIKC